MKKFWDNLLDIIPYVWGTLAILVITGVLLAIVTFFIYGLIGMIGVLL